MNELYYSTGPAAYFFDVLDEMFLGHFISEANEGFKAFTTMPLTESSVTTTTTSKDGTTSSTTTKSEEVKLVAGGVILKQLEKGIKDFKWTTKVVPSLLIKQYDLLNKGFLNFKEFVYLMINENLNATVLDPCTNCFKTIRTNIYSFLEFVDCNEKGVNAESLIKMF